MKWQQINSVTVFFSDNYIQGDHDGRNRGGKGNENFHRIIIIIFSIIIMIEIIHTSHYQSLKKIF